MSERHKYADVIIAWANGEKIQGKLKTDSVWEDWPYAAATLVDQPCFYSSRYEWRIAPKTKVVWYNLYLRSPGDLYFNSRQEAIDGAVGERIATLSIEIPV